MNPPPTSRRPGLGEWLYRQLLRLYPAAFRRRHEAEMILIFADEWQRASVQGVAARWRCGVHLIWDVIRTAPWEWTEHVSRAAAMTAFAAGLSATYLSVAPLPPLAKVLGCAALTTAVAVGMVAAAGRGRAAQFKLAALGLPLGLVFVLCIGLAPRPIPPPDSPLVKVTDPALTGPAIYQRMRATYANARTYVDQGEEQTVYASFLGHTQTRPFTTTFVRDGGFRFEFRDQFNRLDAWKEYVVWKDGATVNRWWTIAPYLSKEEDLPSALSAAAGVSGTTSVQIPGLLIPGISTWLQAGPRSPVVLLGTQRVDGRETFRLQFETPRLLPVTMWIDTHSYLVDRIAFRSMKGVEDTMVYHSRIDVAIDPSELTYNPPLALPRWGKWLGGEAYAMLLACAVGWSMQLLNMIHRRMLRKRGRKKEFWPAPITGRMSAGNMAIITVSLGMWLGGWALDGVLQNLVLAIFMLQGGLALHVIHRRNRGHARFAGAL